MNLLELYSAQNLPDKDGKVFNTISIPDYKTFRFAFDD